MSEKVLIIVGDGGESYETWFAVHRFQEAGFVTHVAAPSKRRLNLVIHDFEPGWDTYMERPGYIMESDLTFAEVKPADYFAVLLIGGRAPEYSATIGASWRSFASVIASGSGSGRFATASNSWPRPTSFVARS